MIPPKIVMNKEKKIGEKLTIDEEIELLQETILKATMKRRPRTTSKSIRLLIRQSLSDIWTIVEPF